VNNIAINLYGNFFSEDPVNEQIFRDGHYVVVGLGIQVMEPGTT
jgi:hypothetical protein